VALEGNKAGSSAARNFSARQSRWLGERVARRQGPSAVREQGLGDTLKFVRYASLVGGRGARVISRYSPRSRLFVAGIDTWTPSWARVSVARFRSQCPSDEALPHTPTFGTRADTIRPEASLMRLLRMGVCR